MYQTALWGRKVPRATAMGTPEGQFFQAASLGFPVVPVYTTPVTTTPDTTTSQPHTLTKDITSPDNRKVQ